MDEFEKNASLKLASITEQAEAKAAKACRRNGVIHLETTLVNFYLDGWTKAMEEYTAKFNKIAAELASFRRERVRQCENQYRRGFVQGFHRGMDNPDASIEVQNRLLDWREAEINPDAVIEPPPL